VLSLSFGLAQIRVDALDVIIETETTYSGTVNNVSISGTGYGTLNLTTNESSNDIIFTSFPTSTMNPLYNKSHKCIHHPKTLSAINDLSSYYYSATFVYSGDASGTLYRTATVSKTENGTKSESIDSTWNGTYSGPITTGTDIEFYEIFTPTQNPKEIQFSGYREISLPNNEIVYCEWTGTITSDEDIELDGSYRFDYTWSNVSWNPTTMEFHKDVHIDITQYSKK